MNNEKPITVLPKEPPAGLLESMALRYDHGLGLPGYYDGEMFGGEGTHAKRLANTISTMRQLYEEVSGHGFFQYKPIDAAKAVIEQHRDTLKALKDR